MSQASTTSEEYIFDELHVKTFNNTVQELVTDLKKAFPELEGIVDEKYSTIAEDDTQFIEWFKMHTRDHTMALTRKDESIFETHDTMFILPDINFSELWKCALTKSNKKAVWKYLHVLLLLVSHQKVPALVNQCHEACGGAPIDSQNNALMESGSDNNISAKDDSTKPVKSMQSVFEQWNKMLDSKDNQLTDEQLQEMKAHSENVLKLMENLNDTASDEGTCDDADADADADVDADDEAKNKNKNPFENMENDPFVKQLENSKIAQFAKELSQDLNMVDLGLGDLEKEEPKSFNDMFGKLGKDPSKLFGLVETVGSKIQNKMQNGDIKQNELVEEAQHLMQSMTQSGIFKNAFGNMNKSSKRRRNKGRGKRNDGFDPSALFKAVAQNMNVDPKQFEPENIQKMMKKLQDAQFILSMKSLILVK